MTVVLARRGERSVSRIILCQAGGHPVLAPPISSLIQSVSDPRLRSGLGQAALRGREWGASVSIRPAVRIRFVLGETNSVHLCLGNPGAADGTREPSLAQWSTQSSTSPASAAPLPRPLLTDGRCRSGETRSPCSGRVLRSAQASSPCPPWPATPLVRCVPGRANHR